MSSHQRNNGFTQMNKTKMNLPMDHLLIKPEEPKSRLNVAVMSIADTGRLFNNWI